MCRSISLLTSMDAAQLPPHLFWAKCDYCLLSKDLMSLLAQCLFKCNVVSTECAVGDFFCVRKILFCSGMRECRIAAATAAVEEDGVKIKELHSAMHWVHRGCAHAAAAQLAELLVHYYCYYCCCYRRSAGAPWMHLLRSEPSSLMLFHNPVMHWKVKCILIPII